MSLRPPTKSALNVRNVPGINSLSHLIFLIKWHSLQGGPVRRVIIIQQERHPGIPGLYSKRYTLGIPTHPPSYIIPGYTTFPRWPAAPLPASCVPYTAVLRAVPGSSLRIIKRRKEETGILRREVSMRAATLRRDALFLPALIMRDWIPNG